MMKVERDVQPVDADGVDPARGDGEVARTGWRPKKLDPLNWQDRDAAEPLRLHREPRTQEAEALVMDLLAAVKSAVIPPTRPSSADKLRVAIGALLAGLMQCEASDIWASHGLSRSHFVGLPFGYDIFKKLTDTMWILGFLQVALGWPRFQNWNGKITTGQGQVTRFRMTKQMIDLAVVHGVAVADWKQHWGGGKARAVAVKAHQPRIILKSAKVRRGGFVETPQIMLHDAADPHVRQLHADLDTVNAYLAAHDIGGIGFPGLRRIFNDGDRPGFSWCWGGRFYSLPGGDLYESMDQDERFERITIDGDPIGEVDIRASHLTLLYALLDEPLDVSVDPYFVLDVDRDAVKAWVAQSLGAGKVSARAWSAKAKKDYAKANPGRDIGEDHPIGRVREAVLKRHPVLQGLAGYRIGPLDLQFHEAEILHRAMAILRDQGDVQPFRCMTRCWSPCRGWSWPRKP